MPESKESEKRMLPDGPCLKILTERLQPELQVTGETELIRYMKPTALLLLLAGKVFIPTISKLQESDRLEAFVPSKVWSLYLHRPGVHPLGDAAEIHRRF
jgi:hypothetical protein